MNVYIVVEGRRTEMSVYPAWLGILAPGLVRVHDPWEIEENNYYIFNANGIPAIFDHTVHAIEDINAINAAGKTRIDWLLVCIDTEEESREYIISQIEKRLEQKGNVYFSCRMAVFEQRVSMESWFLGNRKVFKSNPGDPDLLRYMTHCNVKDEDPELMENISEEEFATKAQFHHDYLRRIFRERNIAYTKSKPGKVCEKPYLDAIVERYEQTGHLGSFGRWYNFVTGILAPPQ